MNCQGLVTSTVPCCLSQSSTLVELAPAKPLLLAMNEEAAPVSVWGTMILPHMRRSPGCVLEAGVKRNAK